MHFMVRVSHFTIAKVTPNLISSPIHKLKQSSLANYTVDKVIHGNISVNMRFMVRVSHFTLSNLKLET